MVLREKSSKQKQMGAYCTPPELAYRMTDILTKGRNITTALEPSCGEGVFIETINILRLIEKLQSFTI